MVQDGGECRDVGSGWGAAQNPEWYGRALQRWGKAENFPVKKTCSRNKTVRLVCNEKAGVGLAAGMGGWDPA